MEDSPPSHTLTAENLQEFIVLFEEEFKEKLTIDEARAMASRLRREKTPGFNWCFLLESFPAAHANVHRLTGC